MHHHHHHCCCSEGQCETHGHAYGECCSHDQGSCHSDCSEPQGQKDFAAQLLDLADHAWMEVLKEKIKDQIKSAHGKHLDQLARIVAESNQMRWQNKMAAKKVCNDFHSKIHEFFCAEKRGK